MCGIIGFSNEKKAPLTILLEDPGNLIYATTEFRDFLADAVGGKPHYLIALRRG